MREIKFRGKRIDNNEWIYGYFVKDPKGQCRIYWQPFDEATSNTYHFVKPETVKQFTELLDKNGKDVYEGDIVKCPRLTDDVDGFEDKISQIVYRDHGFWVEDESFGWEGEDMWDWDYIEVIGNIHENPELLNK